MPSPPTRPFVSILLAATLAGPAYLRAQAAPRPDTAVRTALEAYYTDFSARDWDAFAAHFWPGATITTVWRPPGEDDVRVVVTPVPEFVDRAPEGPGSREIFEERMMSAEVRVTGNLAQVWARYRARFGDPGEVMEWEGTDAFTLMERDGQWKIVALAFTSDDQGAATGTGDPPDPTPAGAGPKPGGTMTIESLTPILHAESIEPLLPFWVDRLGFQVISEVREGDRLGFVLLQRDGAQLMIQTRASVDADVPSLADMPTGGAILFIRVDDLDSVLPALEDVEILVPRRRTFYGSDEIFVREPGGNVIGFAAFPDEAEGGD